MRIDIDRLIRSRRKTVGLTLAPDGTLTVRAPLRMPEYAIRGIVAQKAAWIEKKRAELRSRAPRPARAFVEGETFFVLGAPYALRYASISGVRLTAPDAGAPGTLALAPCAPDEAMKRLTAWYQDAAREVFAQRITVYAKRLGVPVPRLRLSSARGRWGSCSATGVNLVWRLVMAPLPVVDYVVVHELAHILRRDHSAAFWKEVERVCPDWPIQRKWLKDHGAALEV